MNDHAIRNCPARAQRGLGLVRSPWPVALLIAQLVAPAAFAADETLTELERKVEELERRDTEREERLRELEEQVREAESSTGQEDDAGEPVPALPGLWQRPVGGASLRLIDISAGVIVVGGGSTVSNDFLRDLQGGSHDPRRSGFNLPSLELGFSGAVDPYLRGDIYMVYFLDAEGESRFELEEAFATTQSLPWGTQIEAGTFFTEFGRVNPQHNHQWDWMDQPFALTRFLGEDGLRGPGFRVSWLVPLPWFAELSFGMQNADGETQVSFLANEEVFEERAIGGRPYAGRDDSDFTFLVRLANGFDVGRAWSAQLGFSAALGPNATGESARTGVYGVDLVAKWRPERVDRGWPFFTFQTEFLLRDYDAAAFSGTVFDDDGLPQNLNLPADDLQDWGFYAQGLWGFRRMFAAGFRYEYGTASGASYDGNTPISPDLDPYRATRHRVSPLLLFQPTEYARVRVQYNYDNAGYLPDGSAHTGWVGLEFGLGAHPAHEY